MKRMMSQWLSGPKDVIAISLVFTYCITYAAVTMIPGIQMEPVISQQFKEIMLIVVSYYFGSKEGNKKCHYIESTDNP